MNYHRASFFKLFYLLLAGIIMSTTSISGVSQNSYKITVKSNAFRDTVCYLGYYYGKFQYSKDTTRFDKKGVAVFESRNETLDRGVYFIIFPNKMHLDFIVNTEQVMTFEVDTTDLVRKTKISGSRENQLFYEYNRQMADMGITMEKLRKLEEKYKEFSHDSLSIVRKQIEDLGSGMQNIREQFVEKNPKMLVSKIFMLTKDPELPEAPIKEDGTKDKDYLFYYFKSNYWKNMDFSDDALVRTPVFHARLERFFSQVVIQHPDSVIKELDVFIGKTENTPELFKYVVWFLTFHFETSQIMGHDAVFVHLADTYYKAGRAFWASESVTQKITERADKVRPILIGKVAPNMALIDTSLASYKQLWSVDAKYTIMIFWDPDCGHCKKEIEKLHSYFLENKTQFGLEVYSVCTDTSLTRWKEKIIEKNIHDFVNVNATRSALGHYQELYDVFATPLIFILDREKKIIAKKISADNVSSFIKQYDAIKNEENEIQHEDN